MSSEHPAGPHDLVAEDHRREPPCAAQARPLMRGPLRRTSLVAHAEPMVWLTGGSLVLALLMIAALIVLVIVQGTKTFWPGPLEQLTLDDSRVLMGEVTRTDSFRPSEELLATLSPKAAGKVRRELREHKRGVARRLLATGNYELTMKHFNWVNSFEIAEESRPDWACVVERLEWGRFYGFPRSFLEDGKAVAASPPEVWAKFQEYHDEVRERWARREHLKRYDIGALSKEIENARLSLRAVEIQEGRDSLAWKNARESFERAGRRIKERITAINDEIGALDASNARYQIVMATADGQEATISLADIVRAYPANRLSTAGKLRLYVDRAWEFISDWPREANSEGGVWPAIFGTVVMTLIMCLLVVPTGVCGALYLREYAKPGPVVSAVRIAVNNLAGVPSIVFGVFGLGFFCYIVGAGIDQVFFEARLPSPTFGTGGVLWASLTLALLTLPVVIVATEEAIAAVPSSMREGSYACGASKWQTIRRIVLPRAMPGIMTGAILALARGAGEVAPLMLVGAVKLAPDLLVDRVFPYIHPERSFMHLGFHIYDLGFQSQNSEAARPMVFTTTLLLILIITILNLTAIFLRSRLRRRFVANQF